VLGLGFLTGLYPAFLLSSFQPAAVLSSARMPAGGKGAGRLREALVMLQFSAVIIFFTVGVGVVSQIHHLESANVGFRREGLLLTGSTTDRAMTSAEKGAFWAVLRGMPGVVGVAGSDIAPGDSDMASDQTAIEGADSKGFWIGDAVVSADFFSLYDAKLLAGRYFDLSHAEDEFVGSTRMTNVILNESAVNALGLSDPEAAIGKIIYIGIPDNRRRIIGVIGNSRFSSPKQKIQPAVFYFMPVPGHTFTSIRYAGVDEAILRTRITTAWRDIAPEIPFEIDAATDSLDKYYKPDRDRSHLFTIGAAVAALISCIGLYGLAAFSTSQRVREIGLRKVLGASRGAVVGLLIGQFLRPVVVASLIAAPVGYVVLRVWLIQFDDRIAITPAPFLLSTGVALTVAVATVGMLAWNAAGTEPGRALRQE
jgi:putative ABC transport system permease protein